jgi:hypothetical protein
MQPDDFAHLFHWRFRLAGDEFAGWRPERLRTVEVEGVPSLLRSLWRGTGGALLSVEVFECASRAAADEQLRDVLANIESTEPVPDESVGDTAFVMPQRTMVLFARANLVARLANADTPAIPVDGLATQLDRHLTTRPEPGGRLAPELARLSLAREGPVPVGAPVPLDVGVVDPLDRPVRYVFLTRLGELRSERGALVYQALSAGTDDLTGYAVADSGDVAVRALTIEVSG